MPFIDTTYFDGQLIISSMNQPYISDAVNAAIDLYEPVCLKGILGLSLYQAFMDGLYVPNGPFSSAFSDAFQKHTPDPRWLWLRDGHVFQLTSKKIEWKGFQNPMKQSPIADYVYYQYGRNRITSTTDVGETTNQTENAKVVGSKPKLTRAWNTMVDQARILFEILVCAKADDGVALLYPELVRCELDRDFYNTINLVF